MGVLFVDFIFLFLERGEGREKEKYRCERETSSVTGGRNPGMYPVWELNQAGTQSTEPQKAGPCTYAFVPYFFSNFNIKSEIFVHASTYNLL